MWLYYCYYLKYCLCWFSAWLEGEDDPVIATVNQRIQDITGLTVDTAELLQVITLTEAEQMSFVLQIIQFI